MNHEKDRFFLELVLKEGEKAFFEHTYPVGAVIVDENGTLISKGKNRVYSSNDLTSHAEIEAIRNAGKKMMQAKILKKRWTLYTSLEPCPMCTGALLFAHIKKVVWILNDEAGFGGFTKIRKSKVFDERFNQISYVEEPFLDLKEKQQELMKRWLEHPNNVINQRMNLVEKSTQ
ncbi:tRNA(adenine34) deaminase [Bacillus pakistanensis]|uniref:tRNA(Adenine34) deaminase n=1 Tax=Rossellomorea pakistanensis TaxID=992288 RepID=A0ABS2N7N9_9BACI|nr:nucleoside deaminase [Bacillus pakistanensis]MBM7583815.1 tRNA(adenine34) deaminase [Bacillus pakistanensis]